MMLTLALHAVLLWSLTGMHPAIHAYDGSPLHAVRFRCSGL